MGCEGRLWMFVWSSKSRSHLSSVLPLICWVAGTVRQIHQVAVCCDRQVTFFQYFRLSVEIETSNILLERALNNNQKIWFWPKIGKFLFIYSIKTKEILSVMFYDILLNSKIGTSCLILSEHFIQ